MIHQYHHPTEQELHEMQARHAKRTYELWDKYNTTQFKEGGMLNPTKVIGLDSAVNLNRQDEDTSASFTQTPLATKPKLDVGNPVRRYDRKVEESDLPLRSEDKILGENINTKILQYSGYNINSPRDAWILPDSKAYNNHEERTLPTYQEIVEMWYR